eukprot:3053215-Amphidinium_carterae.1
MEGSHKVNSLSKSMSILVSCERWHAYLRTLFLRAIHVYAPKLNCTTEVGKLAHGKRKLWQDSVSLCAQS